MIEVIRFIIIILLALIFLRELIKLGKDIDMND